MKEWRTDGDRWLTRFNPPQAWGYQTVPQKDLDGLVLGYDRGKGMGGSTAVNFCAWNVGPADDFDEIARLVEDDEWKWTKAQKRLNRIESYRGTYPDVQEHYKKYLNPRPEDHGSDGLLKVGFPAIWERNLTGMMDIATAAGYRANPDMNSGNPMGISVAPQTAYKGVRSTAADMLTKVPSNLHILTDAQVAHIIFDGKTATGISTLGGQTYCATKDVILSAGSLDTPKILMLSGVGSAEDLTKHDIAVVHELPHVGSNLRDHHHICMTWERAEHTTDRPKFYRSKELQAAARAQWKADQTGPLSEYGCVYALGFLKNDAVYQSEEFKALPEHRKAHMQMPRVPTNEIILSPGDADYFIDPENAPALTSIYVVLMNTESSGTVKLQSSDPNVPLLYDPNYFSHPYDRRNAIESTKQLLKMTQIPAFQKDNVGGRSVPKSDSDEDILDFWKKYSGSTWHMTGTCKMGKAGEEDAVVDNNFRVTGLENLRIADMSVVPIIPKYVFDLEPLGWELC